MELEIKSYFNAKLVSDGKSFEEINLSKHDFKTLDQDLTLKIYNNLDSVNSVKPIVELLSVEKIKSILIDFKKSFDTHYLDLVKDSNSIKKERIDEIFDYYLNEGLFLNRSKEYSRTDYFIVTTDQTFLNKLLSNVLKEITSGKRVCFYVSSNDLKCSSVSILILNKLKKYFENGSLSILISSHKQQIEHLVVEPTLINVVFRSSDFISAIEQLSKLKNTDYHCKNIFFVQESIQENIFSSLFKEKWDKLGLSDKYDYKVSNEDLDTILDYKETKKTIYLVEFSSIPEIIKMINHCPNNKFISIYSKDHSVLDLFLNQITDCPLFWMNTFLEFYCALPEIDYSSLKPVQKTFYFGNSIEINDISEMLAKKFTDLLQKNVALTNFETLYKQIILQLNKFFDQQNENKDIDQIAIIKYLTTFHKSLELNYETERMKFVTKSLPSNFVLLIRINDDTNLTHLLKFLIPILLSNKAILFLLDKNLKELKTIESFIENLKQNKTFQNRIDVEYGNYPKNKEVIQKITLKKKDVAFMIDYLKSKSFLHYELEEFLFVKKTFFSFKTPNIKNLPSSY